MGSTAIGLGLPSEHQYKGKTYKISPINYEMQAIFETWVQKRAWDAIDRSPVTHEVKREMRTDLVSAIAGGEYDFGSQVMADASASIDGRSQLLYLMMKPNHANDPEVTPQFCQQICEEELEQIIMKMNEVTFDPNLTTPAQAGVNTTPSTSLPQSSPENHTISSLTT